MTKLVFGMTISLDGYINDEQGSVARLYPDLVDFVQNEFMQDAIKSVGSVLMGRKTFDMANGDFTGYEFQNPIFVLTHEPPAELTKGQNENLTITFVTDGLESAVTQAKQAAQDKEVMVVGGADMGQKLLNAGLVDELQIGIIPVLLGSGTRMFENINTEKIKLEQIKIVESPQRTDIYYRVLK